MNFSICIYICIQIIQNSAARIITKAKKDEHISPYLPKLQWLPVKFRINFKIIILTFKCIYDEAPSYLKELISIKELPTEDDGVTTRSMEALSLNIPKAGTKHYKDRAFSTAAPVLWNSLYPDIRNIQNIVSFKKAVKTFLFKQFLSEM